MYKNIIAIAIVAVTLTSCSQKHLKNESPMFGIWQINEQTCKLGASRESMLIETDARMSADYVYFKIKSPLPLARSPIIMANNLNTLPIRVEGTGRHFSFEIPYTPHVVSKLMDENSFFVVNYRIANIEKPQKAIFNTRGLSDGISYLSKTCLNY
jgi:hypothetical protein